MVLYRNHDLKIIRLLLKEIGQTKYEQALKNIRVVHKPVGMQGWYLEANPDYLKLCYRYPSRAVIMLMDVERFKNIPSQGWERIKING